MSKQAARGLLQGKQGPFAWSELLPAGHGGAAVYRAEGQQGRWLQCL